MKSGACWQTGREPKSKFYLLFLSLRYEVDGFGNFVFMDDANVPSLLSLPYLGYVTNLKDPLYLSTRNALLSAANP